MRSAIRGILQECQATLEAHSFLITGFYLKLYDDRLDIVEKQRRIHAMMVDFLDIDPQLCFEDFLFLIQNHQRYDKKIFKNLFAITSTRMLMPPNRPVPGDEHPVGSNNDDNTSTDPPGDFIHRHCRHSISGNTDDGISSCTNSTRGTNFGWTI